MISPFEYVSVLISIILGLGITVLLTGLADMIRNWKRVQFYWPYGVWILIIFILHLQEWWTTYLLRSEMKWTLTLFAFIIIYPIVLFILANLLFPKRWRKNGVDMKVYYYNHFLQFFGAALLLILISILQNHFLLNLSFSEQAVQFFLVLLFSTLLITRTKNQRIHALVALVLLSVLVISFIVMPEQLELL